MTHPDQGYGQAQHTDRVGDRLHAATPCPLAARAILE